MSCTTDTHAASAHIPANSSVTNPRRVGCYKGKQTDLRCSTATHRHLCRHYQRTSVTPRYLCNDVTFIIARKEHRGCPPHLISTISDNLTTRGTSCARQAIKRRRKCRLLHPVMQKTEWTVSLHEHDLAHLQRKENVCV